MNLLDTASLVVTPNGYKASKLYSIIPSDGSGDMTFARTGDTATRINSSGLIETVLANKPRLDYFNSTCPKLLLEPQRTNLAIYSEDFGTASLLNATVSTNVIASPSGNVNADKIVENTSNSSHAIYYQNITYNANTTYTISCYLKSGERYRGAIRINGITGDDVFNLNTGIASIGTLTNVGNGWWRYTRIITPTSTVSGSYFAPFIYDNSGNANYLGDGTSGYYIWGLQIEAGSYATSYIPTTTASVTRNVDSITRTSSSAVIGQTEGVVFFDLNLDSRLSFSYLFVKNTAVTNYIGFSVDNTKIRAEISNAGVIQAAIDYASSSTGRFKIAVAYNTNDIAFYLNGSLIGTDTVATIPTCDILDFYFNAVNGIKINSAALWKTRLTNSQLQTLTLL